MMVNQAANTYGNSQPWTNSANTGVNASYAYQQASVPRTGQLNGYGNLSTVRPTADRRAGRDR